MVEGQKVDRLELMRQSLLRQSGTYQHTPGGTTSRGTLGGGVGSLRGSPADNFSNSEYLTFDPHHKMSSPLKTGFRVGQNPVFSVNNTHTHLKDLRK